MSAKNLKRTAGQRAIKRFLRDQGSREYFKDGAWTKKPEEASSFSDVIEVAETCARYGLTNVELALRYGTGAADCDVFCTPIR
ncbi:MAG TPA: hypothetical protein VN578_21895 [Candidatus Binatia bacterium]|jgi:hypothetical protein|nr:hypothetical protein [Candidatus Binatia bacterium]